MVVVWRLVPLSLAIYGVAYYELGWFGVIALPIIAIGLAISSGMFD